MMYCLYHLGEPCAIVSAINKRAAERGASDVLYGEPKYPALAKSRRQCGHDWQKIVDAHCDKLSAEVDQFFQALLGKS